MPLASSPTRSYIIRLKPGQDVTAEIEALTRTHHSQAASIVSVVGSLTRVALRFAGKLITCSLSPIVGPISANHTVRISAHHTRTACYRR